MSKQRPRASAPASAPAPARVRYGPGIIRETPHGTFAAFVSTGHQTCLRCTLKTLADAKAWIVSAASGATPLTPTQAADAAAALALLPRGVTLAECAKYWQSRHPSARQSLTVAAAWDKYAAAVADGQITLRPRTLQSYRAAWSRLASRDPDRPLSAVDASTIEAAIASPSPVQRNGLLRALSAVYGYLVAQECAAASPCASVRPARVPRSVPRVLSVADARAAMRLAADAHPAAVPALALGLFAGLRPDEALRIRPAAIRNGYVILSPRETKTADARNIPVRPNLKKWLARYPVPPTGISARAVKAFRAAWRASGHDWPADVCRHSYATYAYEQTQDAAAVAATMGHVGTDIFFRHYRALAPAGSGRQFFRIEP